MLQDKDSTDKPIQKLPATGYIRIAYLVTFLTLSKPTIWRLVKAGKFPKPIKLSEQCTAWKAEAVHEWLASLESAQS